MSSRAAGSATSTPSCTANRARLASTSKIRTRRQQLRVPRWQRSCAGCVETLDLFVEAYGAEAGNLGLRSVSTGGLFIGGGIGAKILPALTTGTFMRAFLAKPPLEAMLARMPVKVILNAQAGLLGAAVFAACQP